MPVPSWVLDVVPLPFSCIFSKVPPVSPSSPVVPPASSILLGPTGGYLAGFPLGAFATGFLAERGWDRTPLRAFLAMLAGSAPIFALGLLGLSRFVPSSMLLAQGLWPFVPGDVIKSAVSAGLLPLGWKLLGTRN